MIETARLRAEPLRPAHAADALALLREPGVRRYLLDDQLVDVAWLAEVIAGSQAREAEGQLGLYALLAEGLLCGLAGFQPFFEPPQLQLMIALGEASWGQGLGTEIGRALIAIALERGVAVRAATDAPNLASQALIARLGLTRCAPPPGAGAALCYTLDPPAAR